MPPRSKQTTLKFDIKDQNIPAILRKRIESWKDRVPSTQFQQYGPIDRYLNLKFNHDNHMVKPQALFREALPPREDELLLEYGTDPDDTLPTAPGDAEIVEDLRDGVTKGDISIDSTHNGFVDKRVKTDHKAYPDFVVCTFVPNPRKTAAKDRVLIVLEIASVPRNNALSDLSDSDRELADTRRKVVEQLKGYMDNFLETDGDRWEGDVVGIALLGIEVAFVIPNDDDDDDDSGNAWMTYSKGRGKQEKHWFSLYGKEFLKFVNEARDRD